MRYTDQIRIGHRVGAFLAVCLILAAAMAVAPPATLGEQAPSLVLRAPDIPLAALAVNAPIRVEKQAPGPRAQLQRPERTARYLPASERLAAPEFRVALHQTYRDLPRRPLPRRQTAPPAPDDPSH
ncbi:MAG: hypothetical protein ACE147_00115 [Candidatus Methylomirabilales bacterium]